ncbi:MAG TPA: hypothetical protein PLL10_06390, partial [Elusimicrobiales bacterium]|nr:hypothetical protein [Elusimicrobiales bacterium]
LLASPLLLPMWLQMKFSALRAQPLSYAQYSSWAAAPLMWLKGLFWPFLSQTASVAERGAAFYDAFTPCFSHIGYAPLLLLLGWPFLPAQGVLRHRRLAAAVLALLALLWAWGVLSPLLYHMPILNRFRYPLKLLLFANFFLLLAASMSLESWLEHILPEGRRPVSTCAAFAVLLAGAAFVYGISPRRNFYVNLETVPLAEPLKDQLSRGRVLSLGEHEGRGAGFSAHLAAYNFATLSGLQHFAGYDPLLPLETAVKTGWLNYSSIIALDGKSTAAQIKYWRGWGVRWYLVDKAQSELYGPWLRAAGLEQASEEQRRVIFEDKSARPMAYAVSERGAVVPLAYGIKSYGADIKYEGNAPAVVEANLIWLPFFKAYVDGAKAAVLKTPEGKLAVVVPDGSHEVRFVYSDPLFFLGFYLALAVAALLALPSVRRLIL